MRTKIRGCTLAGAGEGIKFYIKPDFSYLGRGKTWGEAASQVYYSFGIACGSLVSFASYSKVGILDTLD